MNLHSGFITKQYYLVKCYEIEVIDNKVQDEKLVGMITLDCHLPPNLELLVEK